MPLPERNGYPGGKGLPGTVKLLLASASPRRAAVLTQLGVPFTQGAVTVDETFPEDLPPEDAVRAVAARKAAAAPRGVFVLAADTVGVLDARVLGKPADAAEARATLLALAGRTHRVLTGVAVRAPDGRVRDDVVATAVTFTALPEAQVDAYVATGEPLGKAGAYAIQGKGAALVERVDGDYFNVVGLPVRGTLDLLAASGFPLPPHLRHS